MTIACCASAFLGIPVEKQYFTLVAESPVPLPVRLRTVPQREVEARRDMTAAGSTNAFSEISVEEQRFTLVAKAPVALPWAR
jgi:hypothetical protein